MQKNLLAIKYPELIFEWDFERNKDISPFELTYGSNMKVYWKCSKKETHHWRASIYSRTLGRGCPFCSGKKVCKDNCLATLAPELAKEWDYEKNSPITPNDVTVSSSLKIYWKCQNNPNHYWCATINNRKAGKGCPYCAKLCRIKKKLEDDFSKLSSQLIKEWHPTKNQPLQLTEVSSFSHKKFFWICSNNHEHVWESTLANRSRGAGCPYCAGKRVSKENSLSTVAPDIAKEWDYSRNGSLIPDDVTAYSNKTVYFRCEFNHSWSSTIANRTNGRGCPRCREKKITDQVIKYLNKRQKNYKKRYIISLIDRQSIQSKDEKDNIFCGDIEIFSLDYKTQNQVLIGVIDLKSRYDKVHERDLNLRKNSYYICNYKNKLKIPVCTIYHNQTKEYKLILDRFFDEVLNCTL